MTPQYARKLADLMESANIAEVRAIQEDVYPLEVKFNGSSRWMVVSEFTPSSSTRLLIEKITDMLFE